MTDILIFVLRFLFAVILGIASIITVIILAPFWILLWIWKMINSKNVKE